MRFMPTMVDSKQNLENSSVIIPDGMLVKVAGSGYFKIGNGIDTFNNLKSFSAYELAVLEGFSGTLSE
jgi:hypothetical protein